MMDTNLFPLWRKPGDEHQPLPGINVELLNAVLQSLDISVVWIRQPFARCLHSLGSGLVDVLNVASYSEEREKYGVYPKKGNKIDVSRRFKYDIYYAFTHKNAATDFDGKTFSQLDGRPVVVEIGASITSKLYGMGISLMEHPHVGSAFKMLEKGRVSAVVTNQYNGLKYMNKNIKRLENPVQEKPYFLVFSHQFYQLHPDTVEHIWFISGQVQDHQYQSILQKYASIPDWPESWQQH
ncbi:substrate-binding periplasmic protein [Planctobacterium marinum]|uniref:Solute-binding protein family 3/N-terminal domain-containing protein n=1 Tax=Planctobacterium marinum TaxID=1631968 RepID=A0AA48HGP3_9ALTE|nr:hypothetical protein MACH26_16020 [Planctobacterium marinum]